MLTALSSCAHILCFLHYNNNTILPTISPSHSIHFKLVPAQNTLTERPVVMSFPTLQNCCNAARVNCLNNAKFYSDISMSQLFRVQEFNRKSKDKFKKSDNVLKKIVKM